MRMTLSAACAIALAVGAIGLVSCSSKSTTAPMGGGGAGELNGSLSSTGAQYMHTFSKAGSFPYHCSIHPSCVSLQGTIVVVAPATPIANSALGISQTGGSAGGPYGGGSCSMLSVSADTVHVGDSVTWTNNSPLPHTVTSN